MASLDVANFIYDLSIPAISRLQSALPAHADLMQTISVTFDPKYAFLVYAPVAFILNPLVGKRIILATVLAEWLNQVLKWLSFGERPYWYLYSSGKFDVEKYPIRQFPITCETGPGAPSGHSQLTAAVWFVILKSLADLIETRNSAAARTAPSAHSAPTPPRAPLLSASTALTRFKAVSSIFYVCLISVVAVSRVYLACHFPQQCVAGAFLGYLLAKRAFKYDLAPGHWLLLSVGMLASAFGVYSLMLAFNFDPSWTFELASRHCANLDYIHVDTTPFFSIMRYCGFALGVGFGLMVPSAHSSAVSSANKAETLASVDDDTSVEIGKHRSNFARVSTRLAVVLIAARLVDNLGAFVSTASLTAFYSSVFAIYAAFSFLIVSL